MYDAQPPIERWSSDRRFGLRVEPAALDAMLTACRRAGRCETGGILVGHYTNDLRLAVITAVSVGTSDSAAGSTWFRRGTSGLYSWLSKLWDGQLGYYIGEWHFHPFAPPSPSEKDVRQMGAIATADQFQCRAPLLVVVGGDVNAAWEIHAEVSTGCGVRHILGVAGCEAAR